MSEATPTRNTVHYVLGFYFRGDKVLLVTKDKPDWQKGRLNGVGGKIEMVKLLDGGGLETPHEAMVREFQEETLIGTCESDWHYVCEMELRGKWHVTVFAMRDDENTMPPCGLKEEPVAFYDVGALPGVSGNPEPHTVISNLTWLIPMCLDRLSGALEYSVESRR